MSGVGTAPGIAPPAAGPRFAALPPLSLYVHVPWCIRKCPYCDFNSHEWRGEGEASRPPQSDYIDALIAELQKQASP